MHGGAFHEAAINKNFKTYTSYLVHYILRSIVYGRAALYDVKHLVWNIVYQSDGY